MSSSKPGELAEFDRWLHHRMKESNLTPKEMQEFLIWLKSRRSGSDRQKGFAVLPWLKSKFKRRG